MSTTSIIAIGRACSIVQALPSRIREAAAALGIEPQMRINGVDHYSERDIEIIGEYLRRQDIAVHELQHRANHLT